MRALKILVVVMGVLLVAGTAALVIAVANRVNHPPPAAPTLAQPSANAIELPLGARIVGSAASGDRLVVTIALADGGEELLIFNLATGVRVATIDLRPKAPAP